MSNSRFPLPSASPWIIALLWSACSLTAGADTLPWQRGTYDPDWAQVAPRRTIRLDHADDRSASDNGSALLQQLKQLTAGDRLEIGPGRYQMTQKVALDLEGSAGAPIWIVAADSDNPPIIERTDASQNLINLGEQTRCRFVALKELDLNGGSVVIRFYDCEEIWLDRCQLYDGRHGGITVNSRNTNRIYITRNHLHHFRSGTGEGMYLGANHGKVVMRNSVIAANHVHHCGGDQGDGIELKQGSYNNWIVANHIHDTHYPCLIVYGTAGHGINLIERNICYRSEDNTVQVQGEAIVRNNLIMAAGGAALASTDHQGKTRNLQVVHNTILNIGKATNLNSWNGRPGMLLANNAIYSRNGAALRFPRGSAEVTADGNVVVGGIEGIDHGYVEGRGLQDFQSISWDARLRNAAPSEGSPLIGSASDKYLTNLDLNGRSRVGPLTVGAVAAETETADSPGGSPPLR